ncbi:rho GTPase-activating protein gacK-like [Rana temporaria]|uniref:rho GTPase-activating protein gacK-like n=1 Tax=Rana temporaria TaxID=8407 RepID=UPI001AAD5F3C|nr:rho GTPase-activating protein gacK-like [Rana temporaria]
MSDPEGNPNPPSYEATMSNSEPTAPMSDVPLTNILKNHSPPPPAYYPPNPDPSWSPYSVIPPWSVDNITPQNTDPSPPFYKAFLMGKPKALGVLIIIVSIFEIGLGIALAILAYTNTDASGISFWGPIFYIIAGSLTLSAYRKPSINLVRGSLSLNVISWVLTVIAVVLNVIDLATVGCYVVYNNNAGNGNNNNAGNGNNNNVGNGNNNNVGNGNDDDEDNDHYYGDHHGGNHHNDNDEDHSRSSFQTLAQCAQSLDGIYVILSLLLITNVLLCFVTLIISVFGCRSLAEAKSTAPQVYVIPNDGMKKPDAFPEFPVQPPPYTATEVKATPTY